MNLADRNKDVGLKYPRCDFENPIDSQSCKECGDLTTACAECGHNVRPTAKFCDECGVRLAIAQSSHNTSHTGTEFQIHCHWY